MSTTSLVRISATGHSEIESLLRLSAEIGADRLLVQASGGNTSIKMDDALWIKASGKWLVFANCSEILVPVDIGLARECLRDGRALNVSAGQECARASDLRPSIETLMHAALPHRVVAHVHSINAIAWAIQKNAPEMLAERLSGLRWQWIPYVLSGLPLAQAVAAWPRADVFVLGNHGVVIGGENCHEVRSILRDLENRLTIPPRAVPEPKLRMLEQFHRMTGWPIACSDRLHSLATDAIARRIAKSGIIYPCQAIFLGRHFSQFCCSQPLSSLQLQSFEGSPYLAVEGSGLLLNPKITKAEYAILEGFAEVLARASCVDTIRYLTNEELEEAMGAGAAQYRSSSDNN
jgi:rhamnose utilization protein RhaD (predicted bifunctional aldolase and dehydrogenase)